MEINQISNKNELYKIANSGKFELLRDSLLTMDKGTSYDNFDMFDCYNITDNDNTLSVVAIRKVGKVIPNAFHLGLIEINDDFKGMGLGTKVMEFLFELARNTNHELMTLRAHDTDRLAFYNKLGFIETKLSIHPVLFMIKYL